MANGKLCYLVTRTFHVANRCYIVTPLEIVRKAVGTRTDTVQERTS